MQPQLVHFGRTRQQLQMGCESGPGKNAMARLCQEDRGLLQGAEVVSEGGSFANTDSATRVHARQKKGLPQQQRPAPRGPAPARRAHPGSGNRTPCF